MDASEEISALELAALLCSRVCHDVISPVGAIVNGLEVLEEESDAEMRAHATELIKTSAAQASAKLQFARVAFGAAGSKGAELDLNETKTVAEGLLAGDKVSLAWNAPAVTMDKDRVKLLLNMALIANAAIPRGGALDLTVEGEASAPTFRIVARGAAARMPEEAARYLSGRPAGEAVDARGVQPLFTGLLGRSLGMNVTAQMVGEDFQIVAGAV